jgi:hypothetical protein
MESSNNVISLKVDQSIDLSQIGDLREIENLCLTTSLRNAAESMKKLLSNSSECSMSCQFPLMSQVMIFISKIWSIHLI